MLLAGLLAGCSTPSSSSSSGSSAAAGGVEAGFESLFDGRTLNGWQQLNKKGDGYGVKDGFIYCARGGGGNLMTEKEYANFVLRFEFRLEAGSNNGLAIRAPAQAGSLAYDGMELQIIDNTAEKYARLRPAQYHGSLYDVAPAKRGALKPVGEWNRQEVYCNGRKIRVTLNGRVILDVDINSVTDAKTIQKHPGLFREKGHLGFLGHNDYIEFRNIRIRELPTARVINRPDSGFDLLFNGENLAGWKGAFDPTVQVAAPEPKAKDVNQQIADVSMGLHWGVLDGTLVYDGSGGNILSTQAYADHELQLEYKLTRGASGGALLRNTTGVVIQSRETTGNIERLGSGGLTDGTSMYSKPTAYGDHFTGDWNRMRIIVAGSNAHVFVNNLLVTKNAPVKNIRPTGVFGLAGGNGTVFFRSIYGRPIGELPQAPKATESNGSAPTAVDAPKTEKRGLFDIFRRKKDETPEPAPTAAPTTAPTVTPKAKPAVKEMKLKESK